MRVVAGRAVALVATTVTLSLGLTLPAGAATDPAPPGTSMDAWSGTPIPAAQVDAAIRALDGIAQTTMARTGMPGLAIVVARDGAIAYAKGFGVADLDTGAPVDADTVFQLASVSKMIGASVVAAVVGTTDIEWNDPVVKHLPYFRLSDPWVTQHVTIGDMYAMRSGLPADAGDDLGEMGFTRRQIIESLAALPLSPFRARYHYANYSTTTGAEAVSQAVGVPWERLSKERIYAPLGMTRTTSSFGEFLSFANRATLHRLTADGWVTSGNRNESPQSPAGMVASSARDLGRWMVMQLANGAYEGRQVVDADALRQTRVVRIAQRPNGDPTGRPRLYGYGTGIGIDSTGRVRWRHSGAFSQGAATNVTLLPSAGIGIAVLSNAPPLGAVEAISDEFLDLVELGIPSTDWLAYWQPQFAAALAALGPQELPPPPANPRPSGPLSSYVGVYANAYYGDVTLTRDGRELVVTIGPRDGVLARLIPLDGDTFAAAGTSVPVAEFGRVDGAVRTLQIAWLQAPGNGTLVRR